MQFIYVIGAQCTGKTTLVEAICAWLAQNKPQTSVGVIRETARMTLQSHKFTREDIRPGGARCLQLQKLIMNGQEQAEQNIMSQNLDFVVADRSGIDPLVYAQMYCGDAATQEMIECGTWKELKSHMKKGTVIICEPVQQWLTDDNVRLMPRDQEEWDLMHQTFCTILDQQQLNYTILPRSVLALEERVKFVLSVLDPNSAAFQQYLAHNDKATSRSSSEATQ